MPSDPDAIYDRSIAINAAELVPQVTWGTSPGMVVDVTDTVPAPGTVSGLSVRDHEKALEYMGLAAGIRLTDVTVDTVFIGSCTNGRIEDLRVAASVLEGQRVADGVTVLVVPDSERVRRQAEAEGIDTVFTEAGAQWRFAGCSMCLGMNPDTLKPFERSASTSNRNFEGRQGKNGRTHLVSPAMAAACAVEGRFVDIRSWQGSGT